jgi:hypothetical protein
LRLIAGARNTERVHERAASRFLALALAVSVALIGLPLSESVRAQESETHVSFLNPSGSGSSGPNLLISDRDTRGRGYHLVAAVTKPPTDPHVVFEIQPPEGEEEEGAESQTIGVAQRASRDTFHLFWSIPTELAAGDYLLRAIVFSGSQEVARDEIEVAIDKEAPAVQLDTHRNGGPLRFVQPRPTAAWSGTLDFTFSEDTTRVEAFYTLDRPGTAPAWTSCGVRSVAEGPAPSRIRCTLADSDDPSQVTAVALVSQTCMFTCNTTILRTISNHSGDAHRVAPFRATR